VLGDSSWVGYRYAELLPIPPLARQRLLELEDAELRLTIIQAYLREHKVLKTR
jgi:Lon protease-like protein